MSQPNQFLDALFSFPPEYLGYFWLITGIILLLFEVGTPGLFFFISFACGSFAAAISAFLGYCVAVQCWVALIVSVVSFAVLKYFFADGKNVLSKTNVDALIGQKALVVKTIQPHKPGRVKIKREKWSAIATNNTEIIDEGTTVTVVSIEGNKVIVK